MLQKFREWLTLVLIVLLPFHALLVTVGTNVIAGHGHAPLTVLALWKEGLLGVILVLACVEIVQRVIGESRITNHELRNKIDGIDWCILGLIALSLALLLIGRPFSRSVYALGFRYDFVPLIAFLILRRVRWGNKFVRTAMIALLMAGTIIAAYGLVTLLLPDRFFTALGYADFHSLYKHYTPLAPFQYIQNISIRRIQSVMSGPNQLGLWLLIPLSIALVQIVARKIRTIDHWLLLGLLGIAIILTFSRTAWIVAVTIVIVALWMAIPRKLFLRMATIGGSIGIVVLIILSIFIPSIVVRISSTKGHFDLPQQAVQIMTKNPLGLGLGMAGPATNRRGDTCVMLQPSDDPSWAKDQPDLCVFLGTKQVQPVGRSCDCPLLTENWYLQIGVELGWMGFALFIALIVLIFRTLILAIRSQKIRLMALPIFLMFLGLSLASLLLHAWEDTAVAYTIWILCAVIASSISNDRIEEE